VYTSSFVATNHVW